jgi:hypothetical protein
MTIVWVCAVIVICGLSFVLAAIWHAVGWWGTPLAGLSLTVVWVALAWPLWRLLRRRMM